MKKPYITVNEFISDDPEVYAEGGTISINGKEVFEDDTAELIEEMIDALISVDELLMADGYSEDGLKRVIIREALKKAGCTE